MNIIFTPFFYLIFYRALLPIFFIFEELIFFNRINAAYLLGFGFVLILQLLFLVLASFWSITLTKTQVLIDRYDFMSKNQLLFYIGIWIFVLFLKYDDFPLFKLAGSNNIVEVLNENKVENLIIFGVFNFVNTLFFFGAMLEKRKMLRIFYIILSIFGVLLYMKKSSLLNWLLFYNYFLIIFFHFKMQLRFWFFTVLAISFGMYTLGQTEDIDLNSLTDVIQIVYNLMYTSSTSYLNYLLIYDGIDMAEQYADTLPAGLGFILYFFNPIFKLFFGIGIEAAIGPYVIQNIFSLNSNLYGFNPTFLVEFWFVFGEFLAFVIVIPFLLGCFVLLRYSILKIHALACKQGRVSYFYLYFMLFQFSMNVQFDALNAIRSVISGFAIFMIFLILERGLFKNSVVSKPK